MPCIAEQVGDLRGSRRSRAGPYGTPRRTSSASSTMSRMRVHDDARGRLSCVVETTTCIGSLPLVSAQLEHARRGWTSGRICRGTTPPSPAERSAESAANFEPVDEIERGPAKRPLAHAEQQWRAALGVFRIALVRLLRRRRGGPWRRRVKRQCEAEPPRMSDLAVAHDGGAGERRDALELLAERLDDDPPVSLMSPTTRLNWRPSACSTTMFTASSSALRRSAATPSPFSSRRSRARARQVNERQEVAASGRRARRGCTPTPSWPVSPRDARPAQQADLRDGESARRGR